MKFIEWSENMSVCSDILDGHHRMIIDCLNNLHPLLHATGHDAELAEVLDKLEDFVLIHFAEEERAMKRAGYPGWREHRDQHDRMYDIVFKLKSDIQRGRIPDAERLFELIYNWLLTHIMGEDRKYIPHLTHPSARPVGEWHWASGKEY